LSTKVHLAATLEAVKLHDARVFDAALAVRDSIAAAPAKSHFPRSAGLMSAVE
jgi:hypothetical protein